MSWLDRFKNKKQPNAPRIDLPHLVVDESHFCYAREDGSESQQYTMPATKEFVLSVGNYKFDIPQEWGWTRPNYLSLMSMNQGQLMFKLKGEDDFVIVAPESFVPGEQLMLMIGNDQNGSFESCWMTLVNIE